MKCSLSLPPLASFAVRISLLLRVLHFGLRCSVGLRCAVAFIHTRAVGGLPSSPMHIVRLTNLSRVQVSSKLSELDAKTQADLWMFTYALLLLWPLAHLLIVDRHNFHSTLKSDKATPVSLYVCPPPLFMPARWRARSTWVCMHARMRVQARMHV